MDLILTILSPIFWLLQMLLSILLWIVWQLFWIVLWLVLPLAIVAYVAMRAAEAALGPELVRGWLKRQSMRLGGGVWDKLSRGLIASSVLPFRVSAWFVLYTIWHAIVGLIWRPRWTPWERAWAKRWKPARAHAQNAASAKRN